MSSVYRNTKDFYGILKVTRNATLGDIKASYRELALKLHPDITNNDPKFNEQFKLVNSAYETLGDESLRLAYDRSMGIFRSNQDRVSLYRNTKVSSNSTASNSSSNTNGYSNKYSNSSNSNSSKKSYNPRRYNNDDDSEWLSYHYGGGNFSGYTVKQTKSYWDMKGNQHQEYFRKQSEKEEREMRRIFEAVQRSSAIDARNFAKENLARKRNSRREGKYESTKTNDSSCTIS